MRRHGIVQQARTEFIARRARIAGRVQGLDILIAPGTVLPLRSGGHGFHAGRTVARQRQRAHQGRAHHGLAHTRIGTGHKTGKGGRRLRRGLTGINGTNGFSGTNGISGTNRINRTFRTFGTFGTYGTYGTNTTIGTIGIIEINVRGHRVPVH
jgi:hypothetical protein